MSQEDKYKSALDYHKQDLSKCQGMRQKGISDKRKLLEIPDIWDLSYSDPQTIFGETSPNLIYDYLDILSNSEHKKPLPYRTRITCSWYEVWLAAHFGKPVRVNHIMAGVDVRNGLPYLIFGYKFIDN